MCLDRLFIDGGGILIDMDKLPKWLQYGVVFAAVSYLAAAIDLYVISLTPFVIAGLAVWGLMRLEGGRCK